MLKWLCGRERRPVKIDGVFGSSRLKRFSEGPEILKKVKETDLRQVGSETVAAAALVFMSWVADLTGDMDRRTQIVPSLCSSVPLELFNN